MSNTATSLSPRIIGFSVLGVACAGLFAWLTPTVWGEPALAASWDHPVALVIWLAAPPVGMLALGAVLASRRRRLDADSSPAGRAWRAAACAVVALFFCVVLVRLIYLLQFRPTTIIPDVELGGFQWWLKSYALLLPAALGAVVAVSLFVPRVVSHRVVVRVRGAKEKLIHAALLGCALVSVITTAGIIIVLVRESSGFFRHVSIGDYLFGTRWTALFDEPEFGVLPLIGGTVMVAVIALLVAVPIGVAAAVFLSEYAPKGVRGVLKPILEILAGVPTVVYGFFALQFVTPSLIKPLFPDAGTFNALSAGLVVGVMIIPTISSLCDDALRAVPRSLREAAFALSATRLEVSFRIVLPAALSGVTAAILLALARAIGETMAVAMAAGMTPNLTFSPLESIQTMTSYIVQVSLGDTPAGTTQYYSIFAVGLTLFFITLVINFVATRVMTRFREAYE